MPNTKCLAQEHVPLSSFAKLHQRVTVDSKYLFCWRDLLTKWEKPKYFILGFYRLLHFLVTYKIRPMEMLEKLNKIYWGKETILEWKNGFAVSLKIR